MAHPECTGGYTPVRLRAHLINCLLFYLLVALSGCAMNAGPVYVKNGKRYGVTKSGVMRNQWWQYYERGLSYRDGEYWAEAVSDLQSALGTHLGQKDQRRANTYGLNFVENYFPHRELGIIYFRLGRYDDALNELTTSLSQSESAKAKFYINHVRQTLIQQTQRDVAAPRIVLNQPRDEMLTNRTTLDVSGSATDDTYVSKVFINGEALFIELAEPRRVFSREVDLEDGPNTLTITAVDLLGRMTTEQRTVVLDRHGPLLSVAPIDVLGDVSGDPAQRRFRIQGTISDQTRITRFILAGQPMPPPTSPDGVFRQDIIHLASATSLPFEVEDEAGNITRGDITLPAGQHRRHGYLISPQWPRWAALNAEHVFADIGTSRGLPVLVAQQELRKEQDPPRIELPGLETEDIIVDDAIFLEGKVTDASLIKAFSIDATPHLKSLCKQLFFNFHSKLRPGSNGFVFEARDEWNNQVERPIRIIHEPPPKRDIKTKLKVALTPFTDQSITGTLSASVVGHLSRALKDKKRFNMIDLSLFASQKPLEQQAEAAKAGKAAGAEGILIGTSIESGNQALEVIASYVDAETAEVIAVEDVYGEQLASRDVKELMSGLALKLQRNFPLLTGELIDQDGDTIFVHFENAKGIQEGTKLIILEKRPPLVKKGRTYKRRPLEIGEARIEKEDDLWEARLMNVKKSINIDTAIVLTK